MTKSIRLNRIIAVLSCAASIAGKLEPWFIRINKAALWLPYIAITVMILMIMIDVAGRFLLNSPLPATVDMSELIMPYLVFIPLAYTLSEGGHVRVSLVLDRMPRKVRALMEVVVCFIGFFFFTILSIWSWYHFWESFIIREQMAAPIYLPWYMGKVTLFIGSTLMAIMYLVNLRRVFSVESEEEVRPILTP